METIKELEAKWEVEGLEFSGSGLPEPAEPWGYDLDDYGISYGKGPWPFYRERGNGIEKSSVRLAPNTAFQAWNVMYASAGLYDGAIEFSFNVYGRKQGLGTLTYPCHAQLDKKARLLSLQTPEAAKGAAIRYIVKFQDFIKFHIAEREAGKLKPITAHEKYDERSKVALNDSK